MPLQVSAWAGAPNESSGCGGARAGAVGGGSPDALRRYLDHIGEPVDPLPISPARAPPQTELALGEPADASADSSDAVDSTPNWGAYIAA